LRQTGSLDPCDPRTVPSRPATCTASAGLPCRRGGKPGQELAA